MKLTIVIVLSTIALIQGAVTPAPKECLSDSECTQTECCYKKHDDLIVSKRGDTFEGYPIGHSQDLTHVKGVCKSYHLEGDSCSPYDKFNGFCSCNEKMGMSCQYVHSTLGVSGTYACKTGPQLASRK